MPLAPSNDIELYYETHGDPADPALLLVHGLGAQIVGWPPGFREELAGRGRFVISFDNRDVGLSTHLDGRQVDIMAVLGAARGGTGEMPAVPYTLVDLADDAVGLLDHLGVESAHVAGVSMGGMIVQQLAISHPDRVRTLTSIMSTTGERDHFESSPEALQSLLSPPPAERDAYLENGVERWKIISSRRYFDPDQIRSQVAAAYDRMFYPEGVVRQMAAVEASGHRADDLAKLAIPTLVIHGRDDTLILPSGGERTAEIVPGANLLLLSDMGHDLPKPLWPVVIDAMVSHTEHAIGPG
jgi:pimeloyl-ACP methyl ester carboxylesterase